jgi:hypothetical protein
MGVTSQHSGSASKLSASLSRWRGLADFDAAPEGKQEAGGEQGEVECEIDPAHMHACLADDGLYEPEDEHEDREVVQLEAVETEGAVDLRIHGRFDHGNPTPT